MNHVLFGHDLAIGQCLHFVFWPVHASTPHTDILDTFVAEHRPRLCLGSDSHHLLPQGALWAGGGGSQHLLAASNPAVHLCVPAGHTIPEHSVH